MSDPTYRVTPLAPGYDLGAFDCGYPAYNDWLVRVAAQAEAAGTSRTHLLVQDNGESRVIGYFAICPTAVSRDSVPGGARSGGLDPVPGYLIAKLALDRDFQGDERNEWGTQLLVAALECIVRAADISGGRVIVVDADNGNLLPFYRDHDFLPTGRDPLRLYMKVATARAVLSDRA